jgi:hypothetical protein
VASEHFLHFNGLPALARVYEKLSVSPKSAPAYVTSNAALKKNNALRLALLFGKCL